MSARFSSTQRLGAVIDRPYSISRTRGVLTLCGIAVAICFATVRPSQTTAQPAAAQSTLANPVRELVTNYCISCHNDRLKTGSLSLEKADAEQVFNSAETWEKVIVKLRGRSMPPAGNRRPDNATYDAVAGWLERELDRAAA